jgi:acetylornithine deacetylase/succinyl-diaminopimelate desuccinylase-like protein
MKAPSTGNLSDWQQAGDETIGYLRDLLRLDTRNPPGNETIAAEYLQEVLAREGIESTIVGPEPNRGTLIARLRGDGSAAPLLLMSHTDVVPVEANRWTQDPFGGEIVDGFMYGRGALDMKSMTALELVTMLMLKRNGVPLKRDVIMMAEADEETGGREGAVWVVDNHPELIRAEYALNEGGGGMTVNGSRYYAVSIAEKGNPGLRVVARGRPGHGSMSHGDNAVVKLARAISMIGDRPLPVHVTSVLRRFVERMASTQPPEVARALRQLIEGDAEEALRDPALAGIFQLMLPLMARNIVTPTMLSAGTRINVIPSEAEAICDARVLPGLTPQMLIEELRNVTGIDEQIEIEPLKEVIPYEARYPSPLSEVIGEVLSENDPEATLVPWMLVGSSDARHVAKLGINVYGFDTTFIEDMSEITRVHGHDERIEVEGLRRASRVFYEIVERFVTRAPGAGGGGANGVE